MSDWLGMAAAPRTPRPELKDHVLQRAQSARRMHWSMLAAAALVGALAGGGVLWHRAGRLEVDLAAARDTLNLLRQPGGRVLMIPVTTAGRPGAMTIYADSLTQAPDFYRRQGYDVIGELPGWPGSDVRTFLRKRLREAR